MTNNERDLLEMIECKILFKLECLIGTNEDIGFWLDGIIYNLSADCSEEFLMNFIN